MHVPNTVAQRDSDLWMELRLGRLTASNFGRIVKRRMPGNIHKFCHSLYAPPRFLGVPSVMHGRAFEHAAVEAFEDSFGKAVTPVGLYIHSLHDFLAASPDGLIEETGDILEVKCAWTGRMDPILPGPNFPYLAADGCSLKRNHNYYYQVQGQLECVDADICHFCVHTHVDFLTFPVKRDKTFWQNEMFPRLSDFYNNEYYEFVLLQQL